MYITVNGEQYPYNPPMTLADLLLQMNIVHKRIAVEVNEEVIPRSQHDTFVITPDSNIEIIHAIGGG